MKTALLSLVSSIGIPLVALALDLTVPAGLKGTPAQESGQPVSSDTFKVEENGRNIFVEEFRTKMDIANLPDWFTKGKQVSVQQEIHLADFSMSGPADISITVSSPIRKASVRPASRNLPVNISGNRLTFPLQVAEKLYVEIDDLPPLCVFANPIPDQPPPPGAPGVISFGPGIHRPGLITLRDNETLYLARGAIVYGGIRATNASNLHIVGEGILDGDFKHESMVLLTDCQGVEFKGITIRNGIGWTNTLIHCKGVLYDGVKVISFGPGGDGIDPLNSSDITIANSFFRCTDDCIAIKAPDRRFESRTIRIYKNTMVGFAYSDGVTIGYETNAPSVSDIEVSDCDILLARGGSRVDGHSGFSIICDGPALIRNVSFSNLRVDEVEFKLFELTITDGTKYGEDPPGRIEDITVSNVHWKHSAPIVVAGFGAQNRVRNILFKNCTVEGNQLNSVMKTLLRTNEFVDGLRLEND